MPPIRRYLRITQHSVLECRIYLDNPADAYRWLLRSRDPILPHVIEAVRPLVLPKLREENARANKAGGKAGEGGGGGGGGGGKRKGWKDVVVRDDFEVAVFLTETSSRHSILRKLKTAKTEKGRLGTTDGKLTSTEDAPVEVGEGAPGLITEEGEDSEGVRMADIPSAAGDEALDSATLGKEESQEGLFVSDDSDGADVDAEETPSSRDRGKGHVGEEEDGKGGDKKKLGMETTYDGFSIYGRILCLVVKRKGSAKGKGVAGGTGQAMMEEWIASTQMQDGQMMDE